jgi:glutamate dehydrogenase
MAANYTSQHQQFIKTIIAAAGTKLTAEQRLFIDSFYALAPLADLRALDAGLAAKTALAAHAFLRTCRTTSAPFIHIAATKRPTQGGSVRRTEVIAINDDKPFLVDSISALFTALGLTIYRVHHPIFTVARDKKGALRTLAQSDGKSTSTPRESLIYFELSPLPAHLSTSELEKKIHHTLTHVATAVADWKGMQKTVADLARQMGGTKGVKHADAKEIHDLLVWLTDNHFVFLGLAEFTLASHKTKVALELNKKTAMGIYRLPAAPNAVENANLPTANEAIAVLKASAISEVHRRANMDYIALRRFDAAGKFVGEFRILGLFTSTVYWRETEAIPFLRRKTTGVMKRAGFDPQSHSGKSLKTALEFLPRDELFQMDEESLFQMAMGIVSLEARPQVRLFVRVDPFERFISATVYVPRERFSSDLRAQMVHQLERAYQGNFVTFYTQVTDSPLARVTIVIATTPGSIAHVDEAAVEAEIVALANNWSEALRDAVLSLSGVEVGEHLALSFATAFPVAYINAHSAQAAAHDIRAALECLEGDGLALQLYRKTDEPSDQLHLKCFTRDLHSELSAIIPLLENMGAVVIDATPYVLTPLSPLQPVLLRNFTLRLSAAATLDIAQEKSRIEQAISAVWRGQQDNDTLNALVISAGLTVRDITILRAYSRYLQQLNFPYSQPLIAAALAAHAPLATTLVRLFHARFDPSIKQRDEKFATLRTSLEAALESVSNLTEDRIIRRIFALIQASLRTNFYQTEKNGAAKSYLSIKFRSALVPEMPLPIPHAEIFVTSMRVEGIHLRGGAVARGGLRWSDRPEDFRSEVLGLVKAQMVKNAVIVPQGAKGGFILRRPPADRTAFMDEGVACYKLFLSGLLDITDNIVAGKLTPPSQTVRHDGDDPYLVVAADKGTASFSDIANGVAATYDFWLGDAFASGGSAGYDHKAMAITARGGWVAVERHFREMGHDIRREDFTCVGIGDMSGDVFGNGMLCSDHIRLIAAFNHRHIFIDPTPDAARSFTERQRLFALPRSGWNDYDITLISKGGGVFDRSAKSIKLTAEMRSALATDATSATPDELIRSILKAPVDLLWNGGIGTYVKATGETHEQVGDRTNTPLRINGRELRCAIVGEGGNLGLTQLGRIEYASNGGRINTDAIDNSGGVDCSDHEVNIKIALGAAVASKKLTLAKRNTLLKNMTDEVAGLVLVDNRLQTQAISIAHAHGANLLDAAEQLIQQLEAEKFLNREVEFLPDAKQFSELRAAKTGLTRPEIAVLLAYAKMSLSRDLKESTAFDSDYFNADLLRYFPKEMQKTFGSEISAHRLRRDIVATMITNSIVNRTGFSFAHSLMRATGLGATPIALAYIVTRDAFNLRRLWNDIESLDATIPATLQASLFTRINEFIEHSCSWFLTHVPQPMDISAVMTRYAAGIETINRHAESLMTGTLKKSYQQAIEQLTEQQVPPALAERIGSLEALSSACDIIDIAKQLNLSVTTVGSSYFELGAQLNLGWLRRSASNMLAENDWQRQAVQSLIIELYQAQRRIATDVITRYGKKSGDPVLRWTQHQAEPLARYTRFIQELRTQPKLDYPMLIVALRQVQSAIAL